jgi:glycosyltransferase involved in cell wall biosynthesis
MKRILLVTRPISPPWDEASKNFAFYLAKNLGNDFEANLMTKDIMPGLSGHIVQHQVYTTAEIAQFSLEQKLRSLYFQFRNKGKFDINHYFFTPTKLNSFLIKNFLKSPQGKTVQTVAALRDDLWSDEDIKKLMFADIIITYSDYAKNKLRSLGFDNVTRIYPGIDLGKFQPESKNIRTMEQFKISANDFVISYSGEYTRLGATDDIVAALPEILSSIPDSKFMFACRIKNEKDARKKDEIIKILKEKNIIDRVIFTDTFADMPKIFNLSDVVIFPVRDMKGKFDVPLAVIEAMACAKPVVISDLPILKEFASDDNSVIIPRGDNQALIEKISLLANDAWLREDIGKNAKKYVEENFDINKVAEKYKNLYLNL